MIQMLQLALLLAAPAVASDALVVRAEHLFLGHGDPIENGALVITNGKVTAAGLSVKIPDGAVVIEHEGWLTPGLFGAFTMDGIGKERRDDTRPLMPEARIVHSLRPHSASLTRNLHAGVTTVSVSPDTGRPCSGASALVKTHEAKVVDPQLQLCLDASYGAVKGDEAPTSLSSLSALLDAALAEGEGSFGLATAQELPVLIRVRDRFSVRSASALAKKHKLQGALFGSYWAEDLVAEVASSGLGVICDPVGVAANQKAMRSINALVKGGVKIGFGLVGPANSPEQLRVGAALCVRAGLNPNTALSALTATAAELSGAGDHAGTLAVGRDADFVLWSGSPIELSSRLEEVWVDGRRVHGGDSK
jgi:imidazolonepropionase-like amidohydrolase